MNDHLQIPWPDWKVVKTLGHGSFGAVYEIERDNFGYIEKAALKVISLPHNHHDIDEMYSEGYDTESITIQLEGYLKEIVQEYSLMAKMKGHSNIVYCDDLKYVQRPDGIGWDIYIRMELLTPLAQTLTSSISDSTVILLGMDICNALIHCKKQQILHRDIKPQNIFVSNNGSYKLGDFGVAKISGHTTFGTKTGTYKYMAPEVYKNEPYGSAADIYSLGLVMYWMLNERRSPFLPLPPQVPTLAMEETARLKRFTGEPLPEPAHGSKELKRIVMKACAYDPNDRYESASEMLEDLLYADDKTAYLFSENTVISATSLDNEKTIPFTQANSNPDNHTVNNTPPTVEPPITSASPKKKNIIPIIIAAAVLLVCIAFACLKMFSPRTIPSTSSDSPSEEVIEETVTFPEPQRDLIASGARQTTIIQSDGTAISDGDNEYGACNVEDWQNLVSVSTGDFFTLGLHEDGTVSAAGDNEYGQCTVSGWKDIIAIAAGDFHSVGLCSDGTLLAVGRNSAGQCDVESLTAKQSDSVRITAVSASFNHTVVLYSDGSVAAVGSNEEGQCDVENWSDISAIYAGVRFTVGLCNDGTVVATGINDYGQCDVENWSDVSMLSAGDFHTIAVTNDGQILATGRNDYGQCDVEDWNNLASIGAGCKHTVAVTNDGQVLATGSNEFQQLNIANWTVK